MEVIVIRLAISLAAKVTSGAYTLTIAKTRATCLSMFCSFKPVDTVVADFSVQRLL
jgi:hypothetical protein